MGQQPELVGQEEKWEESQNCAVLLFLRAKCDGKNPDFLPGSEKNRENRFP